MLRRDFIVGASLAVGFSACSGAEHPAMTAVAGAESKLKSLGIELPPAPAARANYVPYRLAGDILYIAGQGPDFTVEAYRGTLGKDMNIEQGYAAARSVGLNILAQVRAGAGSLNNVVQCLKMDGFVNSADSFKDQAKVLNGATDLFADVFGEAGKPTRFAVGVNTLPFNVAVEIASIWQIET